MNAVKLFFVGLGVALLVSCAPCVMTDLIKTYPAMVPSDSVRIFQFGDSIPNSAEALGKVSIVDDGWTTKCKYDNIIRLVRKEAAEAGGNGFVITNHLLPSFWGSDCHQISGFILRMSDMRVLPNEYNPIMSALALNKQRKEEVEKRTRIPQNIFNIDCGYGIIVSNIYTPYGKYTTRGGIEWKLEYEYIDKTGMGVGIQYAGFKTSFPGKIDMLLTYVAPSLIYRTRWNRWMFKSGVGIGYFACKDELPLKEISEVTRGLGLNANIGTEYMFTKHLGIGVSINTICSFFFDEEEIWNRDEYDGICRINFMGGLRYYF